MATVVFSYDGATTLTATISGATSGQEYSLVSDDSNSTAADATATGTSLVLTVSGIGGLSSGESFDVFVQIGPALHVGSDYLAATVFAFGSTDEFGFPATWTFDGDQTVSVTFSSTEGIPYEMQVVDVDSGGSTPATVTGDGSSKTLTVVYGSTLNGAHFYANLKRSDTGAVLANRLFTAGTADTGVAGNPFASGNGTNISGVSGRVLIALDDGPLIASPTWTRIDGTASLVAGIDFSSGRQTLMSRTDTGTATVLLNDTNGLFDPNNTLSPYYGKIIGRQILLQVFDPVSAEWIEQWRGMIDELTFDVNAATNPDGTLVVANIQMDCVDVFDYLAGYGLTPGLDGVTPPTGSEGTIWYAATDGTVDDRIIEVLTDTGIDSSRYVVFTGNVKLQETNYDADESALTVLRDAADAELPFIANIYVDRQGRFCFHGRESRFDPDTVAAGASIGAWDFTRWKAGDGVAIAADSERAQIRVLSFTDGRPNIVNAVICYPTPKDIDEVDIPGQVYADATSISDYGKHAAQPISDLVIHEGSTTGNDAKTECQKYAELLVKNQKDPRPTITTLTLKAVRPDDPRAAATWPLLTKADISDIVNLQVGYPGGVGLGSSSGEDYYIEGRRGTIRPLNPDHDYVELELDVSPAVWSMDTHGVFG